MQFRKSGLLFTAVALGLLAAQPLACGGDDNTSGNGNNDVSPGNGDTSGGDGDTNGGDGDTKGASSATFESSCKAACDDPACWTGKTIVADQDTCRLYCTLGASMLGSTGCQDQVETAVQCADGAFITCSDQSGLSECSTEIDAASTCLASYCTSTGTGTGTKPNATLCNLLFKT